MAQVTITINKREYAIACENGEELQILKLGRLLDEKATALTSALGHINESQLLAMVGLIIADELTEAKKQLTQAPQVITEKVVEKTNLSDDELENLDEMFSTSLKSLNEAIKSIALNLKAM
jgi:cell division protein ZapA